MSDPLRCGTQIRVRGLTSRQDLNGCSGVIIGELDGERHPTRVVFSTVLVRTANLVLRETSECVAQDQVLSLDTHLELIASFLAESAWPLFAGVSKAFYAAASAIAARATAERFCGATSFGPALCVHRYFHPSVEVMHYGRREAWVGRTVELARSGNRVLLHHKLMRDRGLSFEDAQRMLTRPPGNRLSRYVSRTSIHEGFYRTARPMLGWPDHHGYILLLREGVQDRDGGSGGSEDSEDSDATHMFSNHAWLLGENYRVWRPGSGMGARINLEDILIGMRRVAAQDAEAGWRFWYDQLRTRCMHGDDAGERGAGCAGPGCCTVGKRILEEEMLGGDFMNFWPEFAAAAQLGGREVQRHFGEDPRSYYFGKPSFRRPRVVTLPADDTSDERELIAGVRVTPGELRRLRIALERADHGQSVFLSLSDRIRGLFVQ